MTSLRLGLGPLQLSPIGRQGGSAFDPAASSLAACFVDRFCAAALLDDGAGSYTGVLNDAPPPATGSWRINTVTDRVGGLVFSAPSSAERVTWNHVTKRFEGAGDRRLKRTTSGTPQNIFPNPDYSVFFDILRNAANAATYLEFGTNTNDTRNSLQFNGTQFFFEPRSFNNGGQTNSLTGTGATIDVRYLVEGWVSGVDSRLVQDATLVASKNTNDSQFSINNGGIAIFGRNPTSANTYMRGSSAGIWMFSGAVSEAFEASMRGWVQSTFPL